MDAEYVECDSVRLARAGSGCGRPTPRSCCGTRRSVLDRLAEPKYGPGLRRAPPASRSRSGLHPSKATGPRGFRGTCAAGAPDPRVGLVPFPIWDLVDGPDRIGGPVDCPVVRTRSAPWERGPRDAAGPGGTSPL